MNMKLIIAFSIYPQVLTQLTSSTQIRSSTSLDSKTVAGDNISQPPYSDPHDSSTSIENVDTGYLNSDYNADNLTYKDPFNEYRRIIKNPLNRGPYFDISASKNVTTLAGRTAYLNCRIKNLGNKTVNLYANL